MRAAYLTVLFALSALGAALLVRAITDLVPDPPAPTRSIELVAPAGVEPTGLETADGTEPPGSDG